MVRPHFSKPLVMRRAGGHLLCSAQSHRFFAPRFSEVERARSAVQSAVTGDGKIVLIGAGDFGLQLIQPVGSLIKLIAHFGIYLFLRFPLLGEQAEGC